MAVKWFGTNYPGVRYREHPTRKNGVSRDRYFAIRYQVDGKRREEGLGWGSQGWNARKANFFLSEIREAARTGKGLTSLAEKREVRRKRREKENREDITIEDFWKTHYFPNALANKKPGTCKTEDQFWRIWVSPTIGALRLSDLSPIHVEKIKFIMGKEGKAPRTIKYALALVRQIHNFARNSGFVEGENPVNRVKKPRYDNKKTRFFSREDAERLFEELAGRSPQLHDISAVALYCGLRAGEIFKLTWDDVDPDGGRLFLRDTKSGKNRFAYMPDTIKQLFERLRRSRENAGPDELVFKSAKGGKIQEVSNAFGRAVDALGLNDGITDRRRKLTFHSLRHTFASWLVMDGISLYTVKELLGHSTLRMTERYSHLQGDTLQAAVSRLDRGGAR